MGFTSGVYKLDGGQRVVRFQTAVLWAALTAASAFAIRHYFESFGKADDVHTAAIQDHTTRIADLDKRLGIIEALWEKGCK